MASGPPIPLKLGGLHGRFDTNLVSSGQLNTVATNNRTRIMCAWLDNPAATFTTIPDGWVMQYDAQLGGMRCGLFTTTEHKSTVTADVWGFSATTRYAFNGFGWNDLHADEPVLVDNITNYSLVSATGTTIPVPTVTVPAGYGVVWFFAAKFSAAVNSRTITVPADLISNGNVQPDVAAAGVVARAAAWISGTGGEHAYLLRTPSPTGVKQASISSATNQVGRAGIGVPLRPADAGANLGLGLVA